MKNLLRICTLLLLLLALSPVCYAQFDFGVGEQAAQIPAWQQFPLNKTIKLKLDFRNASPDAVIQVLSKASGIPIVKDPRLTGPITLISPIPVSLDTAFSMFNAEIGSYNASLSKSDNFLQISINGGGGNRNNFTGQPNGTNNNQTPGQQNQFTPPLTSEVEVYVLNYASATNLATVINTIFAPTQNNNAAGAIAAALTGGAFGGGGGGGFGGRGGGGGFGGRGGGNTATGQSSDVVRASADSFSNSLIVNAPDRDQQQIAAIIAQIDKPTTTPQTARVFRLEYAYATDMVPVVQNILATTQNLGRGGSTSTAGGGAAGAGRGGAGGGFGGGGGGGGGFGGRGGGTTASTAGSNANGSVSADTRTNSIIVTTTSTLLDQIGQVIATLDKPATYESSTFVYTMQNARCDVVANLFNEAIGNRTTNGPSGGSLTQQLTQSAVSSSSTTGSSSPGGSTSAGGRGGTSNANSSTVTSNSSSSPATIGLGTGYDIVNIHNLTGQVLLVPMIDTNSIIVVSPPELQPLVKELLSQMDTIPQQVMINVLVAEVSLDKTDQFGIEYSGPGGHGEFSQIFGLGTNYDKSTSTGPYSADGILPTAGAVQGLVYTMTNGQYNAFLQAAATDTKIDVLSTPRIFTTNNATAQINVSESVPYQTGTTITNGLSQTSYDFLDVGLVLTVTPRITSSGYVTMDVSQTDNSIAAFLDGGTEPEVNQREAATTVSVMDGRTVCLGGIIQSQITSTVNKIPVLGDLPLLGGLFRNTTRDNSKDELLVFLTPHVINNPQDAQRIKDLNESQLDAEAQHLIPKSVPTPGVSPSDAPAPQPSTSVSVTPNVQTTPAVTVGPKGATVVPVTLAPNVAPSTASAPSADAPTTPAA